MNFADVYIYLPIGICNGVSRAGHGYLGDLHWIRDNRLLITTYAYIVMGISKISSCKALTYSHLAIFAAVDGVGNGTYLFVFIKYYRIILIWLL